MKHVSIIGCLMMSISMHSADDARIPDQNVFLHKACKRGDVVRFMSLLEQSADINLVNKKGKTPLLVAAHSGALSLVNQLLERKADPLQADTNERTLGRTVLHTAIMGLAQLDPFLNDHGFAKHSDIIKILIEQCPDLCGKREKTGCLPIFFAVTHRQVGIVKLLGEPSRPLLSELDSAMLWIQLTAECSETDKTMMRYIYGEEVSSEFSDDAVDSSSDVSSGDASDDLSDDCTAEAPSVTPLHLACACGNIERIKFLLDEGSNPNLLSSTYKTPLQFAGHKAQVEAIQLLLERHADPKIVDTDGRTALHATILGFDIDGSLINDGAVKVELLARYDQCINLLLNADKEVGGIIDAFGNSPAVMAAKKLHAQFVRRLEQHECNISAADREELGIFFNALEGEIAATKRAVGF